MKIIADKDGWVPTKMSDYLNLAVGGRLIGLRTFTAVLRYLSLVPQGSVQTLNMVCHCPDHLTLAFQRDFVFSEQSGVTTIGPPDPQDGPFTEVTITELMQLNELDSIDGDAGLIIGLADVRAAFTANAELRLFCIGRGANEQIVQTLANLLQVKIIAFTDAIIAFRVEVLEGATVGNRPTLSKRILATPRFSSGAPFVYNNFEQMVTEDAAKTGKLTILPRRS
jgi:hypothetical protein